MASTKPAADGPSDNSTPIINDNPAIQSYYYSLESRLGYRFVLGGTRHFAYWDQDTWFPFPLGPPLRRMEAKLLEALELPSGSRVLDAGCGVGHVALFMAKEGGLRVRAIDIVDHHVEKARRNVKAAEAEGKGKSSGSGTAQGAQTTLTPGQITVDKMDYHHLETIPDASLEGVYTMETLVHATDPEAVLQGFLRVLKPGGHVAFFEYDHDLGFHGGEDEVKDGQAGDEKKGDDKGKSKGKSSSWMAFDMLKVNDYAAMPTYQKSRPGYFRELLEGAGFEDVVVRDYSQNVKPMLRLFYYLGIVPYLIIRFLGLERHFANTIAGVLGYAAEEYCHYLAISARKPGNLEVNKTK